MAGNISKNSRRNIRKQELTSKWGGEIQMRAVFEKGKIKYFAECQKTGNRARKPKQLM